MNIYGTTGMPLTGGYPPAMGGFQPAPLVGVSNPYAFTKDQIKSLKQVFSRYERDRKQQLNFSELQALLAEFYGQHGRQTPPMNMIIPLAQKYDWNMNGQVTKRELKNMLLELSGYGNFDRNTIKQKMKHGFW